MSNSPNSQTNAQERIALAKQVRSLAKDLTALDPKTAGMLIRAAKAIERQPGGPEGGSMPHDMARILQTACDADEGDPKELLHEIAAIAAKYPWPGPRQPEAGAGREAVLDEALAEIDKWIKRGDLPGNGCDQTAQNGGMILAYNLVFGLRHQGRPQPTPAATDSGSG